MSSPSELQLTITRGCVCSACSIYYRIQLDHSADTTFSLIPVNISTMCEMFVGVICACMPAAAYAARQKNSMYQKVVTKVSSLKSSWKDSRNTSCSDDHRQPMTAEQRGPDVLKSTDRKYAQYFSVDEAISTKGSVGQKSVGGDTDSFQSQNMV